MPLPFPYEIVMVGVGGILYFSGASDCMHALLTWSCHCVLIDVWYRYRWYGV